MPPIKGTTTPKVVTPTAGAGQSASAFSCKAFQGDDFLSKIATDALPALARGAPKGTAVQVVQTALFSLGFIEKRTGLDGSFGPGTETAVKAFQASAKLEQTGVIDGATLKALDKAAGAQIQTLKAGARAPGSKRVQYRIVADLSNPAQTRLYVLGKDDKVAARFLTSPGRAEFPTQGDTFKVQAVLPRRAWNPPQSAWAANAKPIPPGIDNPMGILKLSLGAYSQYIHGIPPSEEPELGHVASHGCLRMSGSNILELGELYAEAGTDVSINRDARKGAALQAAYEEAGLKGIRDRPTDAGREYMFGYLSGELGKEQAYTPAIG